MNIILLLRKWIRYFCKRKRTLVDAASRQKTDSCSYSDYLFASKNEIPERWLRAQEDYKRILISLQMKDGCKKV